MTDSASELKTIHSFAEGIQILIASHPEIGLDVFYAEAIQLLESAKLLLANGDANGACSSAIKSSLNLYRAAYSIAEHVDLVDFEDTAKSLIDSAAWCLDLVNAAQAPEDKSAEMIRRLDLTDQLRDAVRNSVPAFLTSVHPSFVDEVQRHAPEATIDDIAKWLLAKDGERLRLLIAGNEYEIAAQFPLA